MTLSCILAKELLTSYVIYFEATPSIHWYNHPDSFEFDRNGISLYF